METRANYILIGLFTMAAVFGAFAFVFWFQHLNDTQDRVPYKIVFNGPVAGLRSGAPVSFNGLRVGEVQSVSLEGTQRVSAVISVETATPIRDDTRVGLDFQGLTGIVSVALRGGAPDAKPLAATDGAMPTLEADAAASQDVVETMRMTLRNIDKVVSENQEAVRSAMKSLDTFTTTLANNSERVDAILAGAEALVGKNGRGELYEVAQSIKELADNLDRRTAVLTGVGQRTISDIGRAVRNFDRNPTRLIFGGPTVFPPEQTRPPRVRALPQGK